MEVRIVINCDNAAFGTCPELETARILQRLGVEFMMQAHIFEQYLYDINGNKVGSVSMKGEWK